MDDNTNNDVGQAQQAQEQALTVSPEGYMTAPPRRRKSMKRAEREKLLAESGAQPPGEYDVAKGAQSSAQSRKAINREKPGEVSAITMFAWETLRLPRVNLKDMDQVYARTDWYFAQCVEKDMRPGLAGVAASLGINRVALSNWGNVSPYDDDAHRRFKNEIMAALDQMWELYMQQGIIHPVAGIFIGKNNYGYRDQQEMVVTPNNPLGDRTDVKELAERYAQSVVIEDADGEQ